MSPFIPPLCPSRIRDLAGVCRDLNEFPIFLSHYYPKTKSHPIADPLSELIEECVQYLSAMSATEVLAFVENLPPGFRMMIDCGPAEVMDTAFLQQVALYYLASLVQQHSLSFKEIVTNDLSASRPFKAYPELQERCDEHGLLTLDDTLKLSDCGIEYKDHVLHYHQFLRRGFTGNPNFDFLRRFAGYYHATKGANHFRVAIDHCRLMPREFFQHIVEMDAWFGPPFDSKKLDDPNAIGLTVHRRVRPSLFEIGGARELDETEFFWSFRKGIKTFQVEELSNEERTFEHYCINRYAHSQRNVANKVLQHFDGAAKVYLKSEYPLRRESRMPREAKSYKKVKLFRIDGNIGVDVWTDLLAHFFKGNEMVVEHLNPAEFEKHFGARLRAFQNRHGV